MTAHNIRTMRKKDGCCHQLEVHRPCPHARNRTVLAQDYVTVDQGVDHIKDIQDLTGTNIY